MARLSLRLTSLYHNWIFVLILLLTGLTTQAQKTWTGSTTDWNTAANWSPTGVPIASDNVVIPSSPANQPLLSTTAVANTVEVQSGASLSITAAGSLILNGSKNVNGNTVAFNNVGLVDNSGQLIIGNTASVGQYGIRNPGTFNNRVGSEISIDRSSLAGLLNGVGGNLLPPTLGRITIDATDKAVGQISIDRSSSARLANGSGTFTNSGRITIGANASVGSAGINNYLNNIFINDAVGQISIDRCSLAGLINGVDGAGGNSTFTNSGQITIGANASVGVKGIENGFNGDFTNNTVGQISIDRSSSVGLANGINGVGGKGTFTNLGRITIGANTSVGAKGIDNGLKGDFSNDGCLALINVVADAIISNTSSLSFTNSGTIIENATGNSNISNNTGIVQNLNGGTFNVGSGPNPAITTPGSIWLGCTSTDWNTASNWLTGTVPTTSDDVLIPAGPANQPLLSTTAVANTVEVQSGASLTITAAGSLTLNGYKTLQVYPNSTAFYNQGLVDNSGQLLIGNTANVGNYGIYNAATFNNHMGGQISIDRSSEAGLGNGNSGTFNNAARLSIGANAGAGDNGLLINSGTFTNLIGGEITIDNTSSNGVYGNGGSFFNYAKITIGVNGSVGNFALQSNDFPFGNSGCSAILVANAPIGLEYSFSNSGTIIESSSGNSRITNNTGIVQNLNGGTITIGSGSPAITTPGNIWKGCTSTDWNTATNWLTGTVPTASDDVVIPAGPANQPVLSTTAVANSVEVQSGASLTITATGSLTLNGYKTLESISTSTAFYNGSNVDNSGQLIIGNTANVGNYGIYNAATFNNNMGGEISIDRSSEAGLETNGTFNNAARLSIGANAGAGNNGLEIGSGTFTNLIGGEITIDNTSRNGVYGNGGSFFNYAKITIGVNGSVGNFALQSNGFPFGNSGCSAILVANAPIGLQYSSSNSGTIIESASGNSQISTNTGIVQNRNGGTFDVGSGPNQPLSLSSTNASTCSPADGSITISGLHANTTYTLSYTVNGAGSAVNPNPTSNGSGQLTVSNLAAGTYALTLGGTCVPLPLSLSASLSGPASPTASLVSSGSLTCAIPSVTLTASGGSSYAFSGPGLSQSGVTNTAVVSQAGTYVVIVTAASGCTAIASTTVYANTTLVAPSLQASASSSTNQPISVTATGCTGTINWNPQGGTGSAAGSIYTFSAPGNYSLSASCTLESCTSSLSTPLSLTILPSKPASFSILGVTLISCQPVSATERQITFTPQYAGTTGQPIIFSVYQQLSLTTQPGPYTLKLNTSNPLITLIAQQNGEIKSLNYPWLNACNNPGANRPPTTTGIVAQAAQLGQNYNLGLATYFSDPDGQPLSFRVLGLPFGLNLTGSVISGTPSLTGTSPISVTAVDPGGLSVTTSFVLTVNPQSTPNRASITSGISAQAARQGQAYSLGLSYVFFRSGWTIIKLSGSWASLGSEPDR